MNDLLSTGSLLKWLQRLGLGQAKAGALELHLGILQGWQGPKHVDHLPLPSRAH